MNSSPLFIIQRTSLHAYHLPLNRIICFFGFFVARWVGVFWDKSLCHSACVAFWPTSFIIFVQNDDKCNNKLRTLKKLICCHLSDVVCQSVRPTVTPTRILIVFHCFCFRFECHLSVNLKSHSQLPDLRAAGFSVSVEIPHGNNGIIMGICIVYNAVYKHDGIFLLPILSLVDMHAKIGLLAKF